jgi:hypothetical protein
MGLFPSEAEVRRRRRDQSMAAMLYTEPDDYSEPRGTNEGKSTGTNEAKARRKRGLDDTLASARELQRIEDEMDDEPILSAVLTASAARRSRGDKNAKKEKKEKKEKKDRKRDEDGSREEDGSRDEKRKREPAPNGSGLERIDDAPYAKLYTKRPSTASMLILKSLGSINDILVYVRTQGALGCAIDIPRLAWTFVSVHLPNILSVSQLLSPDAELGLTALALLGVIVCELAGFRVEVRFVLQASITLIYVMKRNDEPPVKAVLMDLVRNASAWDKTLSGVPDYAVGLIKEACKVAMLRHTQLSAFFLVGIYRIITLTDVVSIIRQGLGAMLNRALSALGALWNASSSWRILLAIACIVTVGYYRRDFIATGSTYVQTLGISRCLTNLRNRLPNLRNRESNVRGRSVSASKFISLGIVSLLACSNLAGYYGTPEEKRLIIITLVPETPPGDESPLDPLFDAISNCNSGDWLNANTTRLNRTATELLTNFSNTCPGPWKALYSYPSPDSGQETEEPAQEPKDEQQNKGPEKEAPDVNGIFSILQTQIGRWHSSGPGDSASCRPDTRWALVGELEATIKKCLAQLPGNKKTLWAKYEADLSTSNSTSSFLEELHSMAKGAHGPTQTLIGVIQEAAGLIMKYTKELSSVLDTAYSHIGDKNKIKRPDVIKIMRLSDHEGSMPYLIDPVSGALARDSSGALVMYTDGMIDEEAKEIADGLLDVDRQLFINRADPSRRAVIAQLVARLFGYKGAFTAACDVGPYEDLSAVLKEWDAVDDDPRIRQLEDAKRGLFGRLKIEALPLLPWASLPAMQQGLEILDTIAGPLESEPVHSLRGYMSNATAFFKLRDDVLVKAMAKAEAPPNDRPDIVWIYSLIEQAQPNGKMPYKRTVSGVIERDNDRAPVKVSADAGPKGAEQDAIDQLLVIDRAILDKQLLSKDPTDHEDYEEHRYYIAALIARLSGYKGEDPADSVTKTLYTLSVKVASAKASGDKTELRNALRTFVEENKKEKGFTAFLPILDGKLPAENIAPYNGPDLKLNAVHRVYEFLREHTAKDSAAPNNNGTQHETQRQPNKVLSEEIAETLTSAVKQYTQVHPPIGTDGILEAAVIQALRYLGVPTWDTPDKAGIETINTAIRMVEDIFEQTREGIDKSRLRHLLFVTRAITRDRREGKHRVQ